MIAVIIISDRRQCPDSVRLSQDWQQEDLHEIQAEVVLTMRNVLQTCQQQEPDLWPKAVTAAFTSAVQAVPCLVSTDKVPCERSEGSSKLSVTQEATDAKTPVLGMPSNVEEDLLAQLCSNSWQVLFVTTILTSTCT